MENVDPAYPMIYYYVMLGGRTASNPISILPPLSMKHWLLQYLTKFPHNVYHYLEGCDYLQKVLISGIPSGLEVTFVFNDSLDDARFPSTLSTGLNVFLVCTDNYKDIVEMNIKLSRVCSKNCLFWIDDKYEGKFIMPNVITSEKEFWDYLFNYSQPLYPQVKDPLCVPKCGGSVKFPYFKPANITFFTLSSALGNWGVGTFLNNQEEQNKKSNSAQSAISNMYSWNRQEEAVKLISQLYGLCQDAFNNYSNKKLGFSDQNYPPLLIAAPYTNIDVRELVKLVSKSSDEFKEAKKILELEQTSNYCHDFVKEEIGEDINMINYLIGLFHVGRIDYLDIVANLHSSFRFSPYLRLPLIGKSINTELSFVSAKNSSRLTYSKDQNAYDNAIHKVGGILASKLLSPGCIGMLEKMPAQIVAITDLPIEWMEINGVPLGFSHDVCRMPETPASGLLAHYGIARFNGLYKIPEDIISKTLVIYGCRDDEFREWQDKADLVAQSVGAKTKVCMSINEFELAVKQYKPEFLIIDTHGGTDLEQHQSYIYMGNEKVYPKDIAQRGIYAKMVFISACNTAPCYNEVNTVANALLEVGASAVTSSYLPLDIQESSTLYIRILNQLSIACKQDIHRNWLAFISHVLRTSYIMTPVMKSLNGDNSKTFDPMSIGKVNTLSMYYENRAALYRKLKAGEIVEGLKNDYSKAVPHYLMYTTIGRADLLEFESFVKNRKQALKQ